MNYLREIKLSELPNSYAGRIPAVRYLYEMGGLKFQKSVTLFVGENGTGKSTLLEAIAVSLGFNAEGGSRDFSFSTKDTHSDLGEVLTVVKSISPEDGFFLRAESFYNTASYLDRNSTLLRYGGVSFHAQSHGESFLSLVTNRFEGNGLYILDEPEAALSPQRQLSLIAAIDDLVKHHSQFIIATHSPIIMAYPDADVKLFSDRDIKSVSFRETEHYKITKEILDNPEQMMHYLLGR